MIKNNITSITKIKFYKQRTVGRLSPHGGSDTELSAGRNGQKHAVIQLLHPETVGLGYRANDNGWVMCHRNVVNRGAEDATSAWGWPVEVHVDCSLLSFNSQGLVVSVESEFVPRDDASAFTDHRLKGEATMPWTLFQDQGSVSAGSCQHVNEVVHRRQRLEIWGVETPSTGVP